MKVTYDMSSFIWRAMLAGKDLENGRAAQHDGKEVWINSAEWGYENTIGMMCKVLEDYNASPIDMIMVFEGASSKSKRLLIYSEYKAGRDHPAEAYVEFEKCRDMLQQTWLDLGACAVTQAYAEGDDTLAYLAQEAEEPIVIASYDNDMAKLNYVNAYGAQVETWINGLRGVNTLAVKHDIAFDARHVTVFKALVGDTGDGISGCKGFGPKAFGKFIAAFGHDGLDEFDALCQGASLDPLHAVDHPLAQMICAQEEVVLRSYELARLRPEWVNTYSAPLEIRAGMVKAAPKLVDDRLSKWYGKVWLVTAKEFAKASAFLLSKLAESPYVALDIETSTPEESDPWVEASKTPVDVFGSKLTGMGLTLGCNNQYTMYFSVDHADTENIASFDLCDLVAKIKNPLVIQNVLFEIPVLYNAWGDRLKDNGFKGFLPNVLDTAFEASYVDENNKRGLKERSLSTLRYTQVTYDQVTTLTGVGLTGGRLVSSAEEHTETLTRELDTFVVKEDGTEVRDTESYEVVVPATQTRKYKMNELSARHVLSYGTDDPRCTAALHNHYKFVMQMEHSWETYKTVEIDAAYLHAQMFLNGVDISLEKMNELSSIDTVTFDKSWATLRDYLISKQWQGTVPPVYTQDITPALVKEAYTIVTGKALDTMVRTMNKLVVFCREVAQEPVFAGMLDLCLAGPEGAAKFTTYVQSHYKNEPVFNDGSPKQLQDLMYTVMGLPVRVRNKVTAAARAKGERQGSPKTDALAIAYALRDATEEQKAVLEALKLMAMVGTRRSLYYDKYPYMPHWLDGKVHSSHNQCSTNTRRASSSSPNLQQLPKSSKIEGQQARFREIIIPHHKDAVIVSLDFAAQELRQIACYSRDPGMLSCFIGDSPKDMHAMTGLGIWNRVQGLQWTYEEFMSALHDTSHERHKDVKKARTLGKVVNFAGEFGSQAPKLAQLLMVTESEGQIYLDSKEAAFPVSAAWKRAVIAEVELTGFVTTKLGARRHLRDLLNSADRWEASKATRQSVNFKIQSSSAEQTKLAEGRMWVEGIFEKWDARYIAPVHDETLASVAIKDLYEFLPAMHRCMVAPYGGMVVPIESSISIGPDLYRQIELGSVPSREAIEKGLAEVLKMR